jgi:hypothetical protein
MNRRIRKKKIDAMDRLLADGLRLYADRPGAPRPGDPYEELPGPSSLSPSGWLSVNAYNNCRDRVVAVN